MIDDSENKDFVRTKFCESENKIFVARFISIEQKSNSRITNIFPKILPVDAKRLCKVYLQKAFLLPPFSYRDIFPKK